MQNPYKDLPDYAFWSRSVAGRLPDDVDPVTQVPFGIAPADKVATAGSCFAQHISRALEREGLRYLVTERQPASIAAQDENFGVFTARFGNIYTVRQLLQLFQRAYGLFEPDERAWIREDGAFLDPFRPNIQKAGFPEEDQLGADRAVHLAAVRDMFQSCDVFVFTLGLTEGWIGENNGAVFPLAPGTMGQGSGRYAFKNFSVDEMTQDLSAFIRKLRALNPAVRIILTVSPVSLIATYERQHVLVSTIYSKSALRVVAETVSRAFPAVAYFPSYEIVTGPQARGQFLEPDLRSVTAAGVERVLSVFRRHFVGGSAQTSPQPAAAAPTPVAEYAAEYEVVCDEELLDE